MLDGAPPGQRDSGPERLDAAVPCPDPNGDFDGDGIPDGVEGCRSGRDTDGDQIPDWQDTDSDGDGLNDGDEDKNGDGQLGCCLVKCNTPGSVQQKACTLTQDGCGQGQKCVQGACTPEAAFKCAAGETSPRKKDTFGDGKLDNERGTFVCRDATPENPLGRRPMQYKRSDQIQGDWHVALEMTAKYSMLTIANPGSKMYAAAIDHTGSGEQAAGFILSRATTSQDVEDVWSEVISAIRSSPPGGSGTQVTIQASDSRGWLRDLYPAVQGVLVDLALGSKTTVSAARDGVVAAILGKRVTDLSNLPQPYGSSSDALVLKLTLIKRYEYKRDKDGKLIMDSEGHPEDSGDRSKWRLVAIGALAVKTQYQDPTRRTGWIVDDLSNGTAVADYRAKPDAECDAGTIQALPVADIIWVVDESGSMGSIRQDIVNNANNLFSRALSSGLDFRMGVTNVCSPTGSSKAAVGRFCSRISSSASDLGGTDRFLLPSEQTIYSACVQNPPGLPAGGSFGLVNAKEAVKLHLPRAASDPSRIRTSATLVIIVATDEFPQSLYSTIGSSNRNVCTLDSSTQAAVDAAVQPYLNLLTGVTDPEAVAMFHVIGGACNNTCGAFVSHGYKELAQKLGGQWADVCQKNLGSTLQVIADSITGAASPVVLDYVPISASLAMSLDARAIPRSRSQGFDYRLAKNSLVLNNIKYGKGSKVIVAYKRFDYPSIFP